MHCRSAQLSAHSLQLNDGSQRTHLAHVLSPIGSQLLRLELLSARDVSVDHSTDTIPGTR